MGVVGRISRIRRVKEAIQGFTQTCSEIIDLTITIQQIAAPTFSEALRADFVEQSFGEIGLNDVFRDEIDNVYARWPGLDCGPPVVITAHTDTVFPSDTDLTVRFENGSKSGQDFIFGPGLADNALGVAGLLKLAEALRDYHLVPSSDIWFAANVCEEGLGDLRGMKAVVKRFGQAAAYIVVEGGSFGSIFHQAIGVRRFRLDVSTPGGHSWGDYGQPSAVHHLSRIVTAFDEIDLPAKPKTSINVGIIEGGTSVNTIAASASCLLDCRSAGSENLKALVAAVEKIVARADKQVNVTVAMEEIGNRPAGNLPADAPPALWAAEALKCVGYKDAAFMSGSTDANVPISLGLPTVCIGLARSANTHRLDEYLDPAHIPQGMGQLLLLTLAAAGFDERNE